MPILFDERGDFWDLFLNAPPKSYLLALLPSRFAQYRYFFQPPLQ